MNIAEFFVNLGVTGSAKTKSALGEVKGGLKEAGSMALETKAAIVAAMYAVERMFSASNKLGSGLTNFNATLDVSTDTLQRYQYAAQQVGVSNDAVTGSFRTLQTAMTKILMGEPMPKGLSRVALMVGGMKPEDILEYQKHPEKLIQILQEYAEKETNVGLRNENLKSFGLGDDMVAALVRKAFRPDVLSKAPVYSDQEIKTLDRNNAAWKNLGQKIEMAFGRFNAKHGDEIIDGISKIADATFRLVEALTQLADKMKVFEKFKSFLDFLAGSFEQVNQLAGDTKKIAESGEVNPSAAKKAQANTEKFLNANEWFKNLYEGIFGKDTSQKLMDMAAEARKNAQKTLPEQRKQFEEGAKARKEFDDKTIPLFKGPNPGPAPERLAPTINKSMTDNSQQKSIQVEVNQTNQFNASPNDLQKTADNMKDSARFAFRQMAAQTVGA